MKSFLSTFFKSAVSAGLLGFLIYQAEPAKILESLRPLIYPSGLLLSALALISLILAYYLMAWRWQILLSGYGHKQSLSTLFNYYMVGLFFNNFLPTSIGGDVVRIYKIVSETEDRTSGFASVIIERIIGIAATLFIALIGLYAVLSQYSNLKLTLIIVSIFMVIIFFFWLMTRNRPFRFMLRLFEKLTLFKIGERINKLLEAIHFFRTRRRILLFTFILSLFSQLAIVLMNYLMASALLIKISFLYLMMVVPVTFVLTMLPSINGVGIRDGGFVYLLRKIKVSAPAALSISIMNLILPLILSIYGAILFIIQKNKIRTGEVDAVKDAL